MNFAPFLGFKHTVCSPADDTAYVKKVLDSMRLPGGLVFPMVEDAATALGAVEASRYPPEGIRHGFQTHKLT